MKYLYDDINITKIHLFDKELEQYYNDNAKVTLNIGQKSLTIVKKNDVKNDEFEKIGLVGYNYIFCEGEDGTKYTLREIDGQGKILNGYYLVFRKIIENAFLYETNFKTNYLADEFNLYEGSIPKHFEEHIKNMKFKYGSETINITANKDKDSDGVVNLIIEKDSEEKNFDEKIITRIIELIFLCLGVMPELIKTIVHINGVNINIYSNTRALFNFRSTSKIDVMLCDVNEETINEKNLNDFEDILNEDKLPFPLFLHSLCEKEVDVRLCNLVECIDGLYQIDNARAKANSNGAEIRTDNSLDRRIAHYIDKGACEPNTITPNIFENDIKKDQNLNTELANIRHLYAHQVLQNKVKARTEPLLPLEMYNYYEQKLVLCLRVVYLELIGIDINKKTQNKIVKIAGQIENEQRFHNALKNINSN